MPKTCLLKNFKIRKIFEKKYPDDKSVLKKKNHVKENPVQDESTHSTNYEANITMKALASGEKSAINEHVEVTKSQYKLRSQVKNKSHMLLTTTHLDKI